MVPYLPVLLNITIFSCFVRLGMAGQLCNVDFVRSPHFRNKFLFLTNSSFVINDDKEESSCFSVLFHSRFKIFNTGAKKSFKQKKWESHNDFIPRSTYQRGPYTLISVTYICVLWNIIIQWTSYIWWFDRKMSFFSLLIKNLLYSGRVPRRAF